MLTNCQMYLLYTNKIITPFYQPIDAKLKFKWGHYRIKVYWIKLMFFGTWYEGLNGVPLKWLVNKICVQKSLIS